MSERLTVRRNGFELPFTKWQGATGAILLFSGTATNMLLPALPDQSMFLPWLAVNDFTMLGMIVAGGLTMAVDPSLEPLREKLKGPERVTVSPLTGGVYEGHCYTCDLDVPERTKHCPFCYKCVEQFDHHCPILNNCIGKTNLRKFLTTLVMAILFLIDTLAMTSTAIGMMYTKDEEDPSLFGMDIAKGVVTAVLGLTALLVLPPLGFLCRVASWQIRARLKGLTQYEWFMSRRQKHDVEAGEVEEAEEAEEAGGDPDELEEVTVDGEANVTEEIKFEKPKVDYSWLVRRDE